MKICVLGAGKMGSWLTDALCMEHEVAIYDIEKERLRYVFNVQRLTTLEEIQAFAPELVINCVTLKYTISVFEKVLPYLPIDCILSDIASVKTGLPEYYENTGNPFVSTHPMFGPTFSNLKDLSAHHSIIISESDSLGKAFFEKFFTSLHLNLHYYTFAQHDETMGYSLSIPFSATLAFAACMRKQDAPGTTFNKHMDIAKGLLSEDDYLLTEILLNPHTINQIGNIQNELNKLSKLIIDQNTDGIKEYLNNARRNTV